MEENSIEVPSGVEVNVHDRKITVSGKKGKIEKDFNDPRFNDFIGISRTGNAVVIKYDADRRKIKAMAGTIEAHLGNMMNGVQHGYKYTMRIVYTHFPITITAEKGKATIKNFLGERGLRHAKIIGDTQIKIDKETVELTGIDIESVSQTAANIERACKLSKRDRRIFQDGIYMQKNEITR